MTHSLPEVSQEPEYPSREGRVLTDWHRGRNWHQWDNGTTSWHWADCRCLAGNQRYFKTLGLSAEQRTDRIRSRYASSCLSTSPLALPALALFLADLATNELSFQFVSKLLAHLGTLMEDQIGFEPLQLSSFQPNAKQRRVSESIDSFLWMTQQRSLPVLAFSGC